jgi:type II secretory pathway component GspD/PulD (secretin)
VVSNTKPTGTFTLAALGDKKYTTAELLDLINDGLLLQGYLLVRGEKSLALVAADEKIDPVLVPRVTLDDLAKRGRTELVSVVLHLRSVMAEDIVPQVRNLLGPFGSAVALSSSNHLVLQDTAGNLQRICQLIRDMETKASK